MAEPASSPPSGQAAPRGLVAEALKFSGSFGRHVQALCSLAGCESKEAAVHYLRVIAAVAAALVFVVFGYVILLFFLAFLLAEAFGISWIWISLGLGVLHLLAALACGLYVKNAWRKPVFPATAAELKKDFESLKNIAP